MKKIIYYIFVLLFFIIITIRLFNISSNSLKYNELLDKKLNIYVYGSSAPRGKIYDTNGVLLVDNIGIKTIYYNKIKGITKNKEIEIAKKIASIIDIKEGSIDDLKKYYLVNNNDGNDLITDIEYERLKQRKIDKNEITKLKYERITNDLLDYSVNEKKAAYIYSLMNDGYLYQKKLIKKEVSEEEYAKIMEANIPGVTGEITWKRKYLYDDVLKNLFGTIGSIQSEEKEYYLNNGYELTDIVGKSYIEKEYEEYLKGVKAKYIVNNDYTLTKIIDEEAGNDIYLGIDINIQLEIERILKDKLSKKNNYSNTEYYKDSYALISDIKTGSILAFSGIRLNDNNEFSDISINNINKSFTIGSAVKGATIAVGYKYGLIKEGKSIIDGCIKLYGVPAKCSHKRLGRINDLSALEYSSNYYQFLLAIKLMNKEYSYNMKLDVDKSYFDIYRNTLKEFGLGIKTEIDLPNEEIGIIGKNIKDDLYLNLTIGQYDTYTPIELLQYTNSLATGYRIKPYIVKKVVKDNKVILENKVSILNKVNIEDNDLNRIRKGLSLVLSSGTGKSYVPQGYSFAGKTGTSESFIDTNNDGIMDTPTISSTFIGFYPVDDPKYSIVVLTPNVARKNTKSNTLYYAASKITHDISTFLIENY